MYNEKIKGYRYLSSLTGRKYYFRYHEVEKLLTDDDVRRQECLDFVFNEKIREIKYLDSLSNKEFERVTNTKLKPDKK